MRDPGPFKGSKLGLLVWLHQFYLAWKASRPIRSELCEIHETAAGTQLFPVAVATALAAMTRGGFKCINVSSGGVRKVQVLYSTVNNGHIAGMTLGDVVPFIIAEDVPANGVLCIVAQPDEELGTIEPNEDGEAEGCTLQFFTTQPADDPEENTYYLQICSVGTHPTTGVFKVTPGGRGNGVGDQRFQLCGGPGGDAQWGPGTTSGGD